MQRRQRLVRGIFVAGVVGDQGIDDQRISEFRTSFEIGCLLFIPFLLIDLVVSSILLSAGMMMLPPQMISLPFKLILFILVDGWGLLAKSLSMGFN